MERKERKQNNKGEMTRRRMRNKDWKQKTKVDQRGEERGVEVRE